MRFLLDTDTCSAYIRRPASITHRLHQHLSLVATSAINYSELCVLAYQQDDPSRIIARIDELLAEVQLLAYGETCAEAFARLRVGLSRSGIGVAPLDLQIAATAIAHDLTLVTHNTRHFDRVPGLRLVDWLA